jgi:hypothetical protein
MVEIFLNNNNYNFICIFSSVIYIINNKSLIIITKENILFESINNINTNFKINKISEIYKYYIINIKDI